MTPPDQTPDPSSWTDPAPDRPVPLWKSLAADVTAHVPIPLRNRSRLGWTWLTIVVLVRSSGFHVTLLYRLAHAIRPRLGPIGKVVAAALFWMVRHGYGCSIASTSRLHGGLILPHPQGIVIGGGVVTGPRTFIYQNVTIGGSPGKDGLPSIGSDARIYAGAVISGPILLGDNVMIGANAVVARDVPDRSIVRSPMAEVVAITEKYLSEGV